MSSQGGTKSKNSRVAVALAAAVVVACVLAGTTVSAAPTNVAAGKVATGSAAITSGARITDGDKTAANYASAGSGGVQWVGLDLGQSYSITQVSLWHYFGDARMYHDVIVKLSTTADFSSGVTTVFNNDTNNSAGQGTGTDAEYAEAAAGKTITFGAVSARYVRVWTNGNTVNAFNHYVEVEIYGTNDVISTATPYNVVSRSSTKCVDATGGATSNGTAVQQWACVGATSEQWVFTATDSGYYRLGAKNATGQVWDVTGGTTATADGVLIQLYAYGAATNQQWLPVSEGSGYYHFVARHSGKCLDLPYASTADGVQLQQWTCNGTAAQSFSLTAGGTATPTATATPTPTATSTTAARATATPTATGTPTATATPVSGGTGCATAWDSYAVYYANDMASRGGRNYKAAYWSQGTDPAIAGNAAPNGAAWFPDRFCGSTPTPMPGAINAIVSAVQFDNIAPMRNAFYTYNDFVNASNAIPAFAGTGDTNTRKREAAAALANFAHETGGFWYTKEIQPNLYCDTAVTSLPQHGNGQPVTECACVANQMYYGRGPTQLSWNFNYCRASEWIYGNNNFDDGVDTTLVTNPSIVEQNGTVAWKTAIWYWMTQAGPNVAGWPSVTSHTAILTTDPSNNYGFGGTIRAINGALECNGGNGAQVASRVSKFTNFLSLVGYTGGQFGRNDC